MAKSTKNPPRQRSLPWRKLHSSTENALSPTAVSRIVQKHDLLEDDVRQLGNDLVHPLSEKFFVLGLLKPLYQQKQGEKQHSEMIRLLKRAVQDLNKVHDIARDLYSSDPTTAHVYSELGGGKTLTQTVKLDFYRQQLKERENEGSTWDRAAVNLRRESDEIRPVVLARLFQFWAARGRPLTLTTTDRSGDDRRGGKLLDFANDVVRELTDPSAKLKGETFRKDLDDYRARLRATHWFEAAIDSD